MLTIKELAPYLPYRLKGKTNQYDSIDLLLGIYGTMGHSLTLCHRISNHNTCDYDCNVNEFKPILRPLSDLIKEIEVNGKKFVPIIEISKFLLGDRKVEDYGFSENKHYYYCETLDSINRQYCIFLEEDDLSLNISKKTLKC